MSFKASACSATGRGFTGAVGPSFISIFLEISLQRTGDAARLHAMDIEKAANCLAELGSPSRLAAFRLLVRAGPAGLMVKDIQASLGVPNSTLSHHISRLVFAGLISQTREGRALRCRVRYEAMRTLLDFLAEDCCAGLDSHRVDRAVTE